MSDLSPQARSAVLKALLDRVKEVYDAGRDGADDRLRKLYESDGVMKLEVRVPGVPVPVAEVTLTPPEASVAVDQTARLAWVKRHHPTEVEVETVKTERVRPAFVKTLEARLKVDDEGVVFDPETGERIDWLRSVPAPPPKTTMTFKPNGRDLIAGAYASGVLSLPDLLALPAGEVDRG